MTHPIEPSGEKIIAGLAHQDDSAGTAKPLPKPSGQEWEEKVRIIAIHRDNMEDVESLVSFIRSLLTQQRQQAFKEGAEWAIEQIPDNLIPGGTNTAFMDSLKKELRELIN